MNEFIWVASYPKSGNTWLRFIVSNLVFGEAKGSEDILNIVPDLNEWQGALRHFWQGAHFLKTHLMADKLPLRMPSRSAIYVVRNPLDMVVSAMAYLQPTDQVMRADLLSQVVTRGGFDHWLSVEYGAWVENTESWTDGSLTFPVLTLRYEDMLADPKGHIRKVGDFLGIEVDDQKIEAVAQATSFKSMRKLEKAEIDKGEAGGMFVHERSFKDESFQFMRAGTSGGYRDHLSPEEIETLTNVFRPGMEKHGYL